MHESVMDWVEAVVEKHSLGNVKRVLEVGSFNVNGSVRPFFDNAESYTGVDIVPGPGVDKVIDIDDYQRSFHLELGTCCRYDVIISTEALEHDKRPWVTIGCMARVLKHGGILILTARGFGPDMSSVAVPGAIRTYGPHDWPSDYWRFSCEGLALLFEDAGLTVLENIPDTDALQPGVFIVGTK